jgi:hypothetical protein
MTKKNKKSPNLLAKSPFQTAFSGNPIPKYTISKKVQAIVEDPELDSDGLSLKDRAVLVFELGKILVADEDAKFNEHYLRHASPLAEAGGKETQWVYDALANAIEDEGAEHGDVWYPALPFLLSNLPDIVEEAARIMCVYHPGDGKSVLIGSESILESMTNRASRLHEFKGKDRKAAAVAIAAGIAAVLRCGDLRLLSALNQAWDIAGDEVRTVLSEYFDSRITELQVEFYLSILERSKPGSDSFELAALHLSSCVDPRCMPFPYEREVVTIDRIRFDFGLHKHGEESTVVAQTPVRKYLAKIKPRLLAIKAREKSTSHVDSILAAWQSAQSL